MAKIFVIGDREKNEWVSEFDNNKKLLKFKDELTGAKQYSERQAANIDLKLMQDTGFLGLCSRGRTGVQVRRARQPVMNVES